MGHHDAVFVDNFGQCEVLLSPPEILVHVPSVFLYCTCRISNRFFLKKNTGFCIKLCPLSLVHDWPQGAGLLVPRLLVHAEDKRAAEEGLNKGQGPVLGSILGSTLFAKKQLGFVDLCE